MHVNVSTPRPQLPPGMADQLSDDPYPSEAWMATWFHCSERRLYELRKAGKIPFMRAGQEIRYRRADIPVIEEALMVIPLKRRRAS